MYKKLAQKVRDFFAEFIEKIKNALDSISIRNAEYRALQNEQKTQEKILAMFNKALESSNADLSKSTKVKFCKIENFEKLNKETLNNIKMRSGIVIHDEQELLNAIHTSLNDKTAKNNYSFGAIPNETLNRLSTELEDMIRFKEGQYAFIFSSDDIKHISKHFANESDIADALINLYDTVINYDDVNMEYNGNQTRLIFKKSYEDADYLSVEIVSNKKRSFDLVTYYITKKNSGTQNDSLANATKPGELASQGVSSSANNSVSNSDENVKFSLGKDSEGKELSEQQKYFKDSIVRDDNGTKYALKEYSEHQIENWKSSKSIVVYENAEQLRAFCENAINDNDFKKKLYFGSVTTEMARNIRQATELETENLNCCIRADEIRKILKNSHGNEKTENLRGQRAITIDDIASIPDIIQNADIVRRSKTDYEGKPVIEFVKEIDGKTTVISYVSKKHKDLTVQTMYAGIKGKKNRSLATTPSGANSFSQTSKTLSGTTSIDNVPQNDTDVNNSNMHEDTKYFFKQDSEGKELSEQQEYFKDSKVRDENGNLLEDDIRNSLKEEPDYSYKKLVSKPDMPFTNITDGINYKTQGITRKDIVNDAVNNAKSVGYENENGNAVIYVYDIKTEIIVPKKAIQHSLDRRIEVNGPVVTNIGSILKNSIRINELIPRSDNIEKSYVLIGAAKSQQNEPFIVSFVVNEFTNEVKSIDVLYSVNAKTEPAGSLSPQLSTAATDSNISVSDLLDYVNRYYPDILPEDVLRHYGYSARPDGVIGESVLYSRKESFDVEEFDETGYNIINTTGKKGYSKLKSEVMTWDGDRYLDVIRIIRIDDKFYIYKMLSNDTRDIIVYKPGNKKTKETFKEMRKNYVVKNYRRPIDVIKIVRIEYGYGDGDNVLSGR